jgi:hypothetical protein
MITQNELKQLLTYDADTGEFTWLVDINNKTTTGNRAGSQRKDGYRELCINYKRYLEHRLAWLYTHGTMPTDYIDHIDRDPSNNRINNLRVATQSQNMTNSTKRKDNSTGVIGVSFNKNANKYYAYIWLNKKRISLGYHNTIEEARVVRREAELKYHPYNTQGIK